MVELALVASMAAAAGLTGAIAVMRRLSITAHALSHVALPGIGLAILLSVHPLVGGFAALVIGAVLIWGIEYRSHLPTEAVTGVVFSAALALGALITSDEHLVEALFGGPGALGGVETVVAFVSAVAVIAFAVRARSRLVIRLVSADLARTTGVGVSRLDLGLLLAFAVTVALGLRYLGALLMGSLIIIPAATAMHLARDLRSFNILSTAIAVASAVGGVLLAPRVGVESGPVTILIASALFLVSLLARQRTAR
jgi:ABC-type Mn2+/Zn2+ transport system permease subunit